MQFDIEGKIPPKARPRFNSETKTAYMPPKYMEWKRIKARQIANLWEGQPPLIVAHVTCTFFGTHKGDGDNLIGTILDTLVAAKVLVDDKLKYVQQLHVFWEPSDELKTTVIVDEIQFSQITPKEKRLTSHDRITEQWNDLEYPE